MLRRVRKEDVQISVIPRQDGLAVCLECWKSWMLSDDRDMSASRMRLHGSADEEPQGYDRDVYAEQRIADYRTGEATGAIIEDLKAPLRWAIYKKCGITTQWKFDQLDWIQVVIEAQDVLEQKLRINIDTARFF